MYITIVFILTGLRRRYIINALGYVENSVKVCIIFHNMLGWASVCAVTWRSPCALRLFLHSFSIQAVYVYRNSRICDCLLVADRHVSHISVLFIIIGLFSPKYYKEKKNSTYAFTKFGACVQTGRRDLVPPDFNDNIEFLYKVKDQDILNYNIACCSVWVWNLVADIEGGT